MYDAEILPSFLAWKGTVAPRTATFFTLLLMGSLLLSFFIRTMLSMAAFFARSMWPSQP